MERGVTLSSDKGGLARVVSAPKEANTRYIRPILRRLLPFPSSSSSLTLSLSLLSLNPANAAFISIGRFCLLVVVASWPRLGCCSIEKRKLMMERNCTKGIEIKCSGSQLEISRIGEIKIASIFPRSVSVLKKIPS